MLPGHNGGDRIAVVGGGAANTAKALVTLCSVFFAQISIRISLYLRVCLYLPSCLEVYAGVLLTFILHQARLKVPVEFIDGISNDQYGCLARASMQQNDVSTRLCRTSDLPTCLAIVSLDTSGRASYEFVLDNTATFAFSEVYRCTASTVITNPPLILGVVTASDN